MRHRIASSCRTAVVAVTVATLGFGIATAQSVESFRGTQPAGPAPGGQTVPHFKPGEQGSRNIHVTSHVPLGAARTVGDIEIEQELSRPYVYVSRMSGDP